MAKMAEYFIFRLTSVCDKKCILCCNNFDEIRKWKTSSFSDLSTKLLEIADYCRTASPPHIVFTGGEALLYKAALHESDGRIATLFDIVKMVVEIMPQAKIIVKTGGFQSSRMFQKTVYKAITEEFLFPIVEWRLGWNLYQETEGLALDRFCHTIQAMLNYQPLVSIDTIYDKTNVLATCATLEEGLSKIGVSLQSGTLLGVVMADPNQHRRVTIKRSDHKIVIDLGPSYAPNESSREHDFFSEPSLECGAINHGTSCLYYDTDMSLIHCNDSFVDARVPALSRHGYSIYDDITMLNKRFDALKKWLKTSGINFTSRKDRCFYCTSYILGQQHYHDKDAPLSSSNYFRNGPP